MHPSLKYKLQNIRAKVYQEKITHYAGFYLDIIMYIILYTLRSRVCILNFYTIQTSLVGKDDLKVKFRTVL